MYKDSPTYFEAFAFQHPFKRDRFTVGVKFKREKFKQKKKKKKPKHRFLNAHGPKKVEKKEPATKEKIP